MNGRGPIINGSLGIGGSTLPLSRGHPSTSSSLSSTIAAAIEEQGVATQEISRNVQEASTGTNQVTQNIADVRQSSEETGQSASKVKVAADNLSSLAAQLENEVDKFLAGVRA